MFSFLQTLYRRWRSRFVDAARPASVAAEPVHEAPPPEPESPAESQQAEAPQPVDQEEVRRALEETVLGPVDAPLRAAAALTPEQLRARTIEDLNRLKELPSLQSFARGFIQTASRDVLSVDDMVVSIERDPALCVRVLRMSNSAFIGPRERIEDLPTAVQMIGVVRIRTLIQALYMLRDARTIAPGFDWRHLWVHAIATASLAEELGRHLGLQSGSQLYLAALLHDVGKIALSVLAPDGYRDVLLVAWRESVPLDELEVRTFGVTHCEAGEIFLRQSEMSEAIVAAARHHARPEDAPEEHQVSVALVAAANYVAKLYGLGFSGATVGEVDDLAALPAWNVIEARTGRRPDIPSLEAHLREHLPGLKAMLRSLHAKD